MTPPPASPCIYHITPVEFLPDILASGALLSDAALIQQRGPRVGIGMSRIKERRLRLPVGNQPGTMVGDYVPFYFCTRSVMLYVIRQANHPDLAYRGGQGPILTLEADLHEVVAWAEAHQVRWAMSLSNAGAFDTEFRGQLDALAELDWAAITATDFRDGRVKERKAAELLIHNTFPWELVRQIGTCNATTAATARSMLASAAHQPPVNERREWYF